MKNSAAVPSGALAKRRVRKFIRRYFVARSTARCQAFDRTKPLLFFKPCVLLLRRVFPASVVYDSTMQPLRAACLTNHEVTMPLLFLCCVLSRLFRLDAYVS